MRRTSIAAIIAVAAAATWGLSAIGSPSSKKEPEVMAAKTKGAHRMTGRAGEPRHRDRRQTAVPVPMDTTYSTSEEALLPTRTGVRLSDRTQRTGEDDSNYDFRLQWLDKFASFEGRANLSEEQRVRLLNLLADKQQEAILSWEASVQGEREASPEDIRRAIDDPTFEAYPTISTIEKNLRRELFTELKTFLTTKQYVSFRRTSLLSAMLGYGFWQPLDIETTETQPQG